MLLMAAIHFPDVQSCPSLRVQQEARVGAVSRVSEMSMVEIRLSLFPLILLSGTQEVLGSTWEFQPIGHWFSARAWGMEPLTEGL